MLENKYLHAWPLMLYILVLAFLFLKKYNYFFPVQGRLLYFAKVQFKSYSNNWRESWIALVAFDNVRSFRVMVAIHLAFHFINWTCCIVPFGPFFTRSMPLAQGPYRQVLLPSPHALLERSSLMNYQSDCRFYVGMINGHLAHYLPNDTSLPPCIDWINLRVRH